MSKASPRISLRSVLIGINLVVLILPLAGVQVMRLYESALVRQTESALIAQAAFIAASYRALVNEQGTQDWAGMSRKINIPDRSTGAGQWLPRPPVLDLATSSTLPPFPDGQPGGSAETFAALAGERMMPVLKDAQLTTLAGIRVTDPWGIIIASTGEDVGLSISQAEEIDLALSGEPVSRLRRKADITEVSTLDSVSRTSSVRVFVSAPILMHGRLIGAVMLSRTPPNIVQALYAKRWLLLQSTALLVALVLLMSLLTFRLIASPIRRLASQAHSIASGDASALEIQQQAQVHKPRTREIAQLQEAITNMAATLEQRAAYQQEFSRHVSHEFKTPIAGIRGAIEVLQDHRDEMDEEQRTRFLDNMAADTDRLHRLTERLMELTKAEFGSQLNEAVTLRDCVNDARAGFAHQVQFNTQGVAPDSVAFAQPSALRAVLETLFENAVQHHATEITLWIDLNDNGLYLLVQNNGEVISPSNRDQVFTPFFTTMREHGGTGLGLSIALALMKQMGGSLQLLEGNGPTTFELQLVPAFAQQPE